MPASKSLLPARATLWSAVHGVAARATRAARTISAQAARQMARHTPPPSAVRAALGAAVGHPPAARFVCTGAWEPDSSAGFLLGLGGHRRGGLGFTLRPERVGAWQRAEAVDWRTDGSRADARSHRGVARAPGWVWVGDDPTLHGGGRALGVGPAGCAGRSLHARDLAAPLAVWPASGA